MDSRFPFAQWSERRAPLLDEAADAERRARHWEWSAIGLFEDLGTLPIADAGEDGRWVEIVDARGADYEAHALQHSVGYNFGYYSSLGRLLSLRGQDGMPRMTVLLRDGVVAHARGFENAMLDDDGFAALHDLAGRQGWKVLPRAEL